MKDSVSVIIKPTLACNLSCGHCYHGSDSRPKETISVRTLEKLFRMVSEEYESAWFIWHGGEPLLLPLSFYKTALELEDKYFGAETQRAGNTIQTNGLGIDRKFANFCRDNKINIGVSNEGPCNNLLRQGGQETDKNLDYLSKKDHKFSVSATVSSGSAGRQAEIYRHFRDRGMTVSFSKVMPAGCARGSGLVPDADAYIKGSIEAFETWLHDTSADVPLIPHYLYMKRALGDPVHSDCAHSSCLMKWLCVYPNGDIYPCAKGCPSEYRMCNISEVEKISDAFATEGFMKILSGTIARRSKCMSECDIFEYCNGGCSVDAFYENGIESNGGDSCRIYKEIFSYVRETTERIIREKPDLTQYNKFVKDAVIGTMINPAMQR